MSGMNDTDKLNEVSWEIFKKMRKACQANQFKWGFHFSYSPESSWKVDTKVLILTLNPQVNGPDHLPKEHWPTKPWTDSGDHDFFRQNTKFNIKQNLQWLHQVLALHDKNNFPDLAARGPEYGQWLNFDSRLREFACNNVAMASFVPFRTAGEKDIAPWMWEFASSQCWTPLLEIWKPSLIITIGKSPFLGTRINRKKIKGLDAILSESYTPDGQLQEHNICEFSSSGKICKRNLKYRMRKFKANDKNILLISLPHLEGRGDKGWPSSRCDGPSSPLYKFLEQALKDFSF